MAPRRRPLPVCTPEEDARRLELRIRGRSHSETCYRFDSRSEAEERRRRQRERETRRSTVGGDRDQRFVTGGIEMTRNDIGREDQATRSAAGADSVLEGPETIEHPEGAQTIESNGLGRPGESATQAPQRPWKPTKRVRIAEDRNRVYVFRSDMPADTDVYETSERVKRVKERSIESRIAAPGTKLAFPGRNGELWRKYQRLVTQNTVSPSRLSVYPNGRPRTRPPSRRHAQPAVKRHVVEADMFEKEWAASSWLHPPPLYCSDASKPSKKIAPMDADEAQAFIELQLARRPYIPEGCIVHCCMIEQGAKKEVWLRAAHYADGDSKDPVPGVFTYLPVTLLRPSFRDNSTSAGRKWLVQPGGLGWRTEWAKEDSRVIWEVPQDRLFNKVPAAPEETCDKCRTKGRPCSWTPDMLDRFCDDCADAPRRHLHGRGLVRFFGHSWFTACYCSGT
eukprot:jgi/Undpi1/11889/HiC_scaffold_4.g01588.m1